MRAAEHANGGFLAIIEIQSGTLAALLDPALRIQGLCAMLNESEAKFIAICQVPPSVPPEV
jgi:hypothetical protein